MESQTLSVIGIIFNYCWVFFFLLQCHHLQKTRGSLGNVKVKMMIDWGKKEQERAVLFQ